MHQSFIRYKNYRYAVYATMLSFVVIIAYVLDAPYQPVNGGTFLGYTLGTLGAFIIVFLMWLGVRKRSYYSSLGSVTGWLSAHIYLGLALFLIATLHSGFQFGWNIHTLTYVLMCLVIGSGCWGIYTYLKYPSLMAQFRNESSHTEVSENLRDLDQQALRLATSIDKQSHELVADAIRRTDIGASLWAQLSAKDGSKLMINSDKQSTDTANIVDNKEQHALIVTLAGKLAGSTNVDEITSIQELLEITGNRAALLKKLQKEKQLQSLLQIWLFVHLPLSFALLAALAIHITTVFFYW
ncbi:MAG TPA: hypothetical protein ENJ32_05355 [Crenotrichaceae bacterium]|nr:hypothetical protein [Crenotrichaceae bacterium]